MKITRVDADIVTLGLENPYQISYETISQVKNILVRIHTSGGIVGFGLAAPDKPVTGEAVEPAHKMISDVVHPLIVGADPLRPAKILQKVKAPLRDWPSIYSSVDLALYDILGKVAGLPLFKLLGGFRHRMMTSITIGIMDEGNTVRMALEHARAGFRAIKLKGGKSVEEDIVRTLRVREAVGEKIALRFDANQGYQPDEAVRFVSETRKAKVEILEQPTPRGETALLGDVTKRVSVPVMADESLLSSRDAFKLAKGGLADMINIKLTKVGGLREAAAITAVARSAGMDTMVGCMDELSLGIAAGLSFACASPYVKYADLDGHFGLKGDPTEGTVLLKKGELYPSPNPGLGLTLGV